MAFYDVPLSGGIIPPNSGKVSLLTPGATQQRDRQIRPVAVDGRELPLVLRFPPTDFNELDVSLDPNHAALWCHMRPNGPPSFTQSLLGELISLRRSLQGFMAAQAPGEGLRFFVGASRLPGIFNLGGDLGYFVESIRSRNHEKLRSYAIDCCDVGYHIALGFETPVVTIGLVQGDALGGGFEGALSFQILVAEKKARMGLPEVLFNLFPGMGAYSFLARKIGASKAQRMIMSGRIYSATELHDMGVVDILAEDGCGEEEVRRFMAASAARHRLHAAMNRVARRYAPLTFEEMRDITDIWVETAMQLDETDLRRMERLAIAQRRRLERK